MKVTAREEIVRLIDDACEQNMWITGAERHRFLARAAAENWDGERAAVAIKKGAPAVRKAYYHVSDRMGNKEHYYRLPQIVFPVGKESFLRIEPRYQWLRLSGSFRVVISPYFDYNYSARNRFQPMSFTIEAESNVISLPLIFDHEDLYVIHVTSLVGEEEHELLSANVYALEDDLAGLEPLKADLHIHTTYSDGFEPPEHVVAAARRAGMDVVAITDHNAFEGSAVAREAADDEGLNLTVLTGEEFSLEYSPMHILCLGCDAPIDRKFLTKQILEMPETKRIAAKAHNLSCDVDAFSATQVLLEEIAHRNGLSILAHPYWKPIFGDGTRIDTPESLFRELARHRRFDGIELVSGSPVGEYNVSALQASLAHEMVGSLDDMPVLGITDSHYFSSDPISGKHFTIVLSASRDSADILQALRIGRCCAVEMVDGVPLCYGSHRLAKYVTFLVKNYYPERDRIAHIEGERALMQSEGYNHNPIRNISR